MEKKVRFGDLVRQSGRPQIVTLWMDPRKDRSVARAVKENRMLTVLERPRRTAYGLAGLRQEAHAVFLMFPRRLELEREARVIGINYQLAEEPEVKGAPVRAGKSAGKVGGQAKKAKPARKQFQVRVRRTAMVEEAMEVEAGDRREAEERALERAEREGFKAEKGQVRNEVATTAEIELFGGRNMGYIGK